jgi:hypothetical protein
MAYLDPLRRYFPKSTRYELAQGLTSICHTYLIVVAGFLPLDLPSQHVFGRIGLTYFCWDTFVILCFTFSSTRMFLIHHAVALSVFYSSMPEIGWYETATIRDFYHYIECSNVLLTVWNFANKNKSAHRITPYFALTYVPIRVCVLPWSAYRVIQKIFLRTDLTGIHQYSLCVPIIGLVLISLYYSVVVARITYKRLIPNQPTNTVRH